MSFCRPRGVVLAPVLQAGRRDVGHPALAVRRRAAGKALALDDRRRARCAGCGTRRSGRARSPDRRRDSIARSAPDRARTAHRGGTAASIVPTRRRMLKGNGRSCSRTRARDRRQRFQIGEQVAHVVERHVLIGSVGERREADARPRGDVPFHSAVTKSASLHAPMPSVGSGEMFGT